ncbi:ABC transporter substrate-binding protein [Virgisporangium ochraceum]|uniref:ABC transporter substrate-binding protein n=1 Tax=Virgisporangium ochraceum TaxID=65505 RepID=A0A8J4A293_9ACTN|nr:ABC transporter substrate-binding protein [Virgisporangium ochraceum]GIJ73846.1 ABC transporter substrate-binding protein [Virgisporangium ochraceum]
MRRLLPIALTLTLAAAGAACGGSDSDSSGDGAKGPIKVGLILSLTGNYSSLGTEDKKAIDLAVEEINNAGGIAGQKIETVLKDDKSAPDQSVLAFNEMKGDVDAVIGSPFSNSALATIPLVDREEIPYISLTPADEQVNPVHPYVFVVPATSATYAERMLQYFKGTNQTKVAVAYDTKSSYAVAGFKGMQAKAGDYGVTLVAQEEFQTTTTEFSAVFAKVRASGAQALTVWATGPPAVAFTKQYATAGAGIPLMLTGAQASKLFLDPAGPAAEGINVSSSIGVVGPHLPDGPQKEAVTKLQSAFQAKYGYPPPQFAQDGYSGVKLLAAAIEKAKSADREKVRAALESLDLVTPNGRYVYSKTDHSGLKPDYISVNTVKGGQFVPTDWAKSELAKISGK